MCTWPRDGSTSTTAGVNSPCGLRCTASTISTALHNSRFCSVIWRVHDDSKTQYGIDRGNGVSTETWAPACGTDWRSCPTLQEALVPDIPEELLLKTGRDNGNNKEKPRTESNAAFQRKIFGTGSRCRTHSVFTILQILLVKEMTSSCPSSEYVLMAVESRISGWVLVHWVCDPAPCLH